MRKKAYRTRRSQTSPRHTQQYATLRNVVFIVIMCIYSWLLSTTITIKQDGTGDFTTIQAGIDASSNADTILVYPGTYYENIDYLEKSITVASLYIITPEDSLINQTIIDGNLVFRCVTIDGCDDFSLTGFTLQNGKVSGGSYFGAGGGILIKDTMNGILANCIIINNIAFYGGGISVLSSDALLKSNTIAYNHGIYQGGGLDLEGLNSIVFDPIELNNIYLNYSSSGSEIKLYSPSWTYSIIVDTFTVAVQEDFFIESREEFNFSCLNHKIEQIDEDLYIAPEGSDNNSGLTPDDPLQTIAWAQTLIKRNDNNPHTITLAPGTYSPSLNNQIFPVGIKHGTKYIGETPENTILDAEHQYSIFRSSRYGEGELPRLCIENLKLINASNTGDSYGAIRTVETDLELNNVIIEDCYGDIGSAMVCMDGIYTFKNVALKNNLGGQAIRMNCLTVSTNTNPMLQIEMENVLVSTNYPGQGFGAGNGGGVAVSGHHQIPGDYYLEMINCDFNTNYNKTYDSSTGLGGASCLYLSNSLTADIVNCTFAENTLFYDTGSSITMVGANVNIYNSIMYGNEGYSFIYLHSEDEVNVSHSLIEGGEDNIYYYNTGIFNWLQGNLDEDPLWLGSGEYPYYLRSDSPCIDAGTLDLPAGIELPQYDLAGNPRISGDGIDMGAYEYQDSTAAEPSLPVSTKHSSITNYPNPFNPSTTIKLELAEGGEVSLAIYNIKGQKVKTLLECTTVPGTFDCQWDGKDESGKSVSSGQYIVKLQQKGKETAKKIMLLK